MWFSILDRVTIEQQFGKTTTETTLNKFPSRNSKLEVEVIDHK